MRFQPLIIPGWKNSGATHWQTLWEQKLPNARRVQQRDWSDPEPTEWIGAVVAAVDAATCPVLLIAHSLGCIAAASLPVALHSKIAGALFVAPADVARPGAAPCVARFARLVRHPLAYQSVLVASDNDPYCALEQARQFAGDWGSRLCVVPGAGHLNAESDLGEWPQGLKLLTSLRRRVAWRVTPPCPRIAPLARELQPYQAAATGTRP